ncbi:hypothetical protein NPIL_330961 [Nephila pilipes]|uniref:Uncharacterized protein n=1 Tax=Nephila pilipes TaxID=299642 RepID=A0A8X6PDD1_NEPPI|nr:hypothetical protein NPIL_330961 [Nephila pilipes]
MILAILVGITTRRSIIAVIHTINFTHRISTNIPAATSPTQPYAVYPMSGPVSYGQENGNSLWSMKCRPALLPASTTLRNSAHLTSSMLDHSSSGSRRSRQ